jgi:dolichol kinase
MFAALIEAISDEALHIDDNITIPVSFGIIM